jgi:hypothetical protein
VRGVPPLTVTAPHGRPRAQSSRRLAEHSGPHRPDRDCMAQIWPACAVAQLLAAPPASHGRRTTTPVPRRCARPTAPPWQPTGLHLAARPTEVSLFASRGCRGGLRLLVLRLWRLGAGGDSGQGGHESGSLGFFPGGPPEPLARATREGAGVDKWSVIDDRHSLTDRQSSWRAVFFWNLAKRLYYLHPMRCICAPYIKPLTYSGSFVNPVTLI